MTHNEAAAYVIGQAAELMARVAGMQAENQHRLACGNSIAYGQEAFEKVVDDAQCHHNAAMTVFRNAHD